MNFDGFNNQSNANNNSQQGTGYPNLDSIFNPGTVNQNNYPSVNRNFVIVTSLQEALSKNSPYNSKGLYVHQDGEYEFEILTDYNGRKTYEIYKRVVCTNDRDVVTISKNEFDNFKQRLTNLEEKINAKPATNPTNGTK